MRLLVIRSAALERLDACAVALGGFPQGETDILTHAHFAPGIAHSHPGVNVVAYPGAGNFSRRGVRRLERAGKLAPRYDRVIVLAGNLSGAGHLNVIRAALPFGPVEIYNVNNEFHRIAPIAVVAGQWGRILLSPAFFFATILTLSVGGLLLLGCAVRNGRFQQGKQGGA